MDDITKAVKEENERRGELLKQLQEIIDHSLILLNRAKDTAQNIKEEQQWN